MPTPTVVREPERPQEAHPGARVAMALLRLGQAAKGLAAAERTAAGLTPAQAQTLLFVRYTKPFLATVGHPVAALAATHATAVGVGVADGPAARGPVEQAPNLADRRSSLLRLTPAGAAAVRRLNRWDHALEVAVDGLPVTPNGQRL